MRTPLIVVVLAATALGAAAQDWTQWGAGPLHQGARNVRGQALQKNLADIVYDPFVPEHLAQTGGSLLIHYQAPLVSGNEVYVLAKGGNYTSRMTWETQTWGSRKYEWQGSSLVERWTFESDWKPVPFGAVSWEPVFHPALSGDFLYVPGASGTLHQVRRSDGGLERTIRPFGNMIDSNIHLVSPITVDHDGFILYTALKLHPSEPYTQNSEGGWLVRVAPDGTSQRVTFASLVPGAPSSNSPCLTSFTNAQLPWPPPAPAVPQSILCGSQRPAVNAAPAVAYDGTIYVISRAHFNSKYGYLVAVNPDLTAKWAASLRDRLRTGCGVLIPATGPGSCRAGAALGVDPSDNTPGAGQVSDISSSSPVVTPDGSVLYGAVTRFNYSQGHLMKFSAGGEYLGSYGFGWDLTPAIWEHDGTYSIVMKENRYSLGSYCNHPTFCPGDRTTVTPADPESFYVTQLSADLQVEWKYRNTSTQSCARQPDGSIQCLGEHPNGFEFCVNAPVVDRDGVVYANAEDGYLYAIAQGGEMRERIFQILALGAAYTPASLGPDGRVYSQNSGHLFVVGRSGPERRRGIQR